MIRNIFLLLLLTYASAFAVAQVNMSGIVIDKESKEALTGASVIVKNADGKIKRYATTKEDGSFRLTTPNASDFRLEVSMISFAKRSIPPYSITTPLIIQMEPGTTLLREVTVMPLTISDMDVGRYTSS